jgi:hypothetical protein
MQNKKPVLQVMKWRPEMTNKSLLEELDGKIGDMINAFKKEGYTSDERIEELIKQGRLVRDENGRLHAECATTF